MSRKQQHRKFESITHGPFTADIRVNPKDGIYSCIYGSDEFHNADLLKVRSWATACLRAVRLHDAIGR